MSEGSEVSVSESRLRHMFSETVLTTAKMWKQPERQSLGAWTGKGVTHAQWKLFSHKQAILPFLAAWMNQKGTILREINHTEENAVCSHLYVESKK